MKDYRYKLEKYDGMKTRHKCPQCEKGKTFTRYIDTETGNYLADNVGICSREINCGYTQSPKQYFENNGTPFNDRFITTIKERSQQKAIDRIGLNSF